MEPTAVLENIAREVAKCEKCGLHFSRKQAVPGEGPENAAVMFIGEGPGFYENEQGRPFVGPAGHFLDELLSKADLKREEVFIGNVVKCRPPGNRDPQPDELAACRPFLEAQISAIQPKVIVTLGRFSMGYFIPGGKISTIHGHPTWVGDRLIVPMYHPAAALHQPALRDSIIADFVGLPRYIELARSKEQKTLQTQPISSIAKENSEVRHPDVAPRQTGQSEEPPEQLSLF